MVPPISRVQAFENSTRRAIKCRKLTRHQEPSSAGFITLLLRHPTRGKSYRCATKCIVSSVFLERRQRDWLLLVQQLACQPAMLLPPVLLARYSFQRGEILAVFDLPRIVRPLFATRVLIGHIRKKRLVPWITDVVVNVFYESIAVALVAG